MSSLSDRMAAGSKVMKITKNPPSHGGGYHCCNCGSHQPVFDEIQHSQYCIGIRREQNWTICRFCQIDHFNCSICNQPHQPSPGPHKVCDQHPLLLASRVHNASWECGVCGAKGGHHVGGEARFTSYEDHGYFTGHHEDDRPPSTERIDELAALCYQISDDHGWHDEPREFGTLMMLVVTEIAEAFEAWRDPDHDITDIWYERDAKGFFKPEGVGVELADAIIRIMDHAAIFGIPLRVPLEVKLRYNINREHRHGGKRA